MQPAPAQSDPRPELSDTAELIDHILIRYHETHLAELPGLIAMARRVEVVHRDHPACPEGLADCLQGLMEHLETHQLREEAVLFPAMLAGGHPAIGIPIGRMRTEHQDFDRTLAALALLADGFEPPADACGTWRALSAGCRKLHQDVVEHVRLENEVLFPRFAR